MNVQLDKLETIRGCKPNAIPDAVFASAEPILLKGLVSDWPAVQVAGESDDAIADYLLGFDQAKPVTVYEIPAQEKGRVFYNKEFNGFNFNRTRQTISGVIERLFSDSDNETSTLYIGSTMVDHWLPGFRADNDVDLQGRDSLVSVWMGNQSRIAAHYDFPNNLACCVAGRRRFTLFPPDQAENLYVGPIDFTPSGQAISLVDFAKPDYTVHPRFKQAQEAAISIELEPGDVLFIPSMWWHHVESLDDFNVLVNYWWRTTPVYHGSPNNALLHAILAIKDLPAAQKQVWREIFDTYVFADDQSKFSHIPERARGILNGVDEEAAKALRGQLLKYLK